MFSKMNILTIVNGFKSLIDVPIARTDQSQQFTATQGINSSVIPFSATPVVNMNLSNSFSLLLTGNVTTLSVSNIRQGYFSIIFTQDATGSRTVAYSNSFSFPGGIAPVLTTTPNAVDILSGVCDGTKIHSVVNKNFLAV